MRILACIIVTFLISFKSYSCSCGGPPTFIETISPDNYGGSEFLVQAVVLRNVFHGIEVEILDSYRNLICAPTVMVWGDRGGDCREYTNKFSLGDIVFFNLGYLEEGFDESEKTGDFELSVCGEHFLRVLGGKVLGPITEEVEEMPVQEFEELLGKWDTPCVILSKEEEIEHELKLFPNPVEDFFKIVSEEPINKLRIYDLSGKTILTQSAINKTELRVDVHHMDHGSFLVEIEYVNGKRKTEKMYKK